MKDYPMNRSKQEEENERPPTTDELIAEVHVSREGEAYPNTALLLRDLPDVLRGLCDHVLSGGATAYDVARALASIIDVIETVNGSCSSLGQRQTH